MAYFVQPILVQTNQMITMNYGVRPPQPQQNIQQHVGSSNICRICGTNSQPLMHMFGTTATEQCLVNKINKYLPIVVDQHDNLSLWICHPCSNTVLNWHKLVEKCEATDKLLCEKLSQSQPSSSNANNQGSSGTGKNNETTRYRPRRKCNNRIHVENPALDATCKTCNIRRFVSIYATYTVLNHAKFQILCEECNTYVAKKDYSNHARQHSIDKIKIIENEAKNFLCKEMARRLNDKDVYESFYEENRRLRDRGTQFPEDTSDETSESDDSDNPPPLQCKFKMEISHEPPFIDLFGYEDTTHSNSRVAEDFQNVVGNSTVPTHFAEANKLLEYLLEHKIPGGDRLFVETILEIARVPSTTRVFGDNRVVGDIITSEDRSVPEEARMPGNATVIGDTRCSESLRVSGDTRATEMSSVSGNARIPGNTTVIGDIRFSSGIRVSGDTTEFNSFPGNARIPENNTAVGDTRVLGSVEFPRNTGICENIIYPVDNRVTEDIRVPEENNVSEDVLRDNRAPNEMTVTEHTSIVDNEVSGAGMISNNVRILNNNVPESANIPENPIASGSAIISEANDNQDNRTVLNNTRVPSQGRVLKNTRVPTQARVLRNARVSSQGRVLRNARRLSQSANVVSRDNRIIKNSRALAQNAVMKDVRIVLTRTMDVNRGDQSSTASNRPRTETPTESASTSNRPQIETPTDSASTSNRSQAETLTERPLRRYNRSCKCRHCSKVFTSSELHYRHVKYVHQGMKSVTTRSKTRRKSNPAVPSRLKATKTRNVRH